jgi:hypothetical protein
LNKTVTMLLLALLVVGGGAIHLWRQRIADHERIATLQASLDTANVAARVVAPSPTLAGPIKGVPAPTDTVAEASPSVLPAAKKPSADVASRAQADIVAIRARLDSPENMERVRLLDRARVPQKYPDVGRVLGLSPVEENRLYDLLAQQDTNTSRDLGAYSAGSGETRSQFAGRVVRQNEAEIESMLGSKYSQWKEYKDELPSRIQVKDLGVVLNAGGMPLSDTQAKSLVTALTSARKMPSQLSGPYSQNDRQTLIDAAASYLTHDQLEAYRQMLERQQRPDMPDVAGGRPTPGANAAQQ